MSIFKKSLIGIIVTAGLFLSACDDGGGVGPDNNNTGDDPPITNGNVFRVAEVSDPMPLIAPSSAVDPAVQTAVVGANDFAFNLGAALVNEHRGKNFVVSPYSVWMPLAALVNAAAPQHVDALLAALGAAGVTANDINRAASRMLYDLTLGGWKTEHNPLQIANAVFVGNNVTLQNSFAQTYYDYYRGASINVDFDSQEAVDAVNNWASENTEGLITQVISEFPPLTVAAIANAIYFSDRWMSEFNPAHTTTDDFHAPSGTVNAQFMRREFHAHSYYEDGDVQAIPLYFKSGGGLTIILPKSGGAEDLLASMTSARFNAIMYGTVLAEGTLRMPRFEMDNLINLQQSLKALGVPLFEENALTGLINEPLRISLTAAVQKALIKVDEEGTTAAAVTVLVGGADSDPTPVMTFEMNCDRPFVFILYDRTREGGYQVLFTGVVNQP